MSKILILTSRTGGGHMNLAQSLKDMLYARHEVDVIDPFPRLFDSYYAWLSRHFLKLWDLEYAFTDNTYGSLWLHRMLAILSRKRIAALIQRLSPHLIISTHALLSYTIARAKEPDHRHIPLVFQLTDLGRVHTTWFTEKHAHTYLAPTREIFAQALESGIDKNRAYLTGRPVRKQFLHTYTPEDRRGALTSLNLDPDVFTLFLQGGAKGSAGLDRTVTTFLSAGIPVQIILAAGSNKAIAARFSRIPCLRVLEFTESIAPYMAASDLIAGKAGASFLSEAIMLEKPFLVTSYIPGQEGPNLHFLERYNLGWRCLQAEAQQHLLTAIVQNPESITEKVASIRAYKTWNSLATAAIAPIIDSLLELPGQGQAVPHDPPGNVPAPRHLI